MPRFLGWIYMYVLYYSYRIAHEHFFADFDRPYILTCVDLRECFSSGLNKDGARVHHMPSQGGRPRSQKHRFTLVTLPTPSHLFISIAVAFSPIGLFWSVCECIRAEYPRAVGILTSNVGRKLRKTDTYVTDRAISGRKSPGVRGPAAVVYCREKGS